MRAVGLAGLLTRAMALGAVALALVASGAASATAIGENCATCQGSLFTLQYDADPVATSATTQTFRITLTIDTTGYHGGGIGIDTVAIQVTNGGDGLGARSHLLWAPTALSNLRNFVNQGLARAGCSSGGSGFDCVRVATNGVIPRVGGLLVWKWDLEVERGTLATGPSAANLRVRYVDSLRRKAGDLVCEPITLDPTGHVVPEPSSLGLAAMGMAVLALHTRRSRRR